MFLLFFASFFGRRHSNSSSNSNSQGASQPAKVSHQIPPLSRFLSSQLACHFARSELKFESESKSKSGAQTPKWNQLARWCKIDLHQVVPLANKLTRQVMRPAVLCAPCVCHPNSSPLFCRLRTFLVRPGNRKGKGNAHLLVAVVVAAVVVVVVVVVVATAVAH